MRASTASYAENKCSTYTRYASALFSAVSLYLLRLFSKGTVFPLSARIAVSGKTSNKMFLLLLILLADCRYLCTIITMQRYTSIGTALFRASLSLRYLSAEISAERCTAKAIFINCFYSLSITVRNTTDTDVGGSKQKRVLLSKTCYQTCTRMYRFDNRSQKPHNFTIVHGWTWFYAVTSLTFRQTRVQALYMDVRRLIEDFCFNRCPKHYRPSFCLFLTYGRNSFCEKESVEFFLFLILL